MVTSRDVQEIVSKLSSDKAKTREEGLKLLNTWLEGESSIGFCRYIGQKTAMLKPNDVPHSETWPFLVKLLTQCVSLELSSSKRRLPKLIFAKTLRIVVQRTEDAKYSGKNLLLLSMVKLLFNHIWDVLNDVPSFQTEYGIILRLLLEVKDYRFHMRKRVYCSLVLLYIEKVQTSLSGSNSIQSNPKEDVFRCILTLHSLLENPPGDFPVNLREDIVRGFVRILPFVRDEGKISRKLIECLNTYLLKDGPNLGCQSLEIHDAVRQFLFRCWITTHDRGLKDALILYARLQLNLTRGAADGSTLVEQLLDVVGKDLDQNNICSSSIPWSDTTKDDKCGNLTSSQCGLVELAALVFYRACVNKSKAPTEKRARREHAAAYLKEGLMKGKWLWCVLSQRIQSILMSLHGMLYLFSMTYWFIFTVGLNIYQNAVFCCLIHNYCSRISKHLLIYWFEGICANFERIINDANMGHTYDCLLWILRSLQRLSSVLLLSVSRVETSPGSSFSSNELERGWHTIWSCLMRGLAVFSNVTSVADAALMLLGDIISNDLMNAFTVPQDVWDIRLFKRLPSAYIHKMTTPEKDFEDEDDVVEISPHGLKPPSYHMIRIPYLKKEVNHVHQLMKEHKEDWAKYGCSIMCDGWTDRKHRTLINFLVNCPRGTMFLDSIDASSYSKDANKIFSLLDKFVDKIGEANVVQIVTDSAAGNVLAGYQLHSKKRNRLAQKRLNDLVFVKYNRALKRRYMKRANIDPISLKDIDESNEWLIGRMENELVFDDDSLGWDDVAVAAGVEESNQRTRSSTTRTTHQELVDEEDEWEDEDEAEEEDVDGYKSNDDDDGGDEVLHVDDDVY
ncbi:unnamed protein product [Camellia sinensis]